MFDIGFSEIVMFGAIALIVLGPEKLPQAARSAGKWYAKIRFTIANVQREIEQELDLAETRRIMQEEITKIREAEANMQQELTELRNNVQKLKQHEESVTSSSIDTLSNINTNHISANNKIDSCIDEVHLSDKQPRSHTKDNPLSPPTLSSTSSSTISSSEILSKTIQNNTASKDDDS